MSKQQTAVPAVGNYHVLADIEAELNRARSKFPNNDHMMNAATEELGELSKALLHINYEKGKEDATHEAVYKEAIQLAVMAIRVATEGDSTLPDYDPESGYRGPGWAGYRMDLVCPSVVHIE